METELVLYGAQRDRVDWSGVEPVEKDHTDSLMLPPATQTRHNSLNRTTTEPRPTMRRMKVKPRAANHLTDRLFLV
ncbi:hypothetical protein ATANTOWER_010936 [Ataeniobius toweri]|uniref:Uncharacterized protein n=1 Tax=Ataeniobius toweri TaxID=208326 RepID=A0ABU7CGC9_9TELE|nr:hypothetical protein [Ataeniobius toweri]